MANIIQESFRINTTVLRLLGLYPGKNNSTLTRLRGFTFYFLSYILVSILVVIDFVTKNNYDSLQLNFIAIWLAETVGFTFKVFPLLHDAYPILKCVNFFAHPRFAPADEEERKIINECVYVCKRNSTAYFYGIIGCVTVWTLPVLLAKERTLPVQCWLPYDPVANAFYYYTTLVYLFSVVVYDAFAGTMIDPVIAGLAYHATCQIKILKYNLKRTGKNLESDIETANLTKFAIIEKSIKRCIQLHNDVLKFVAECERCFSWPVFCQLMACTVGLCFSLIGFILASTLSYETVMHLTCFLILCFQILFYCYYGTLLYEENEGLITAIYMSEWYTCDLQTQKVLVTIMERSKRPMLLTSGKVVELTLRTFTSVLKTSYSLIAVLNRYE